MSDPICTDMLASARVFTEMAESLPEATARAADLVAECLRAGGAVYLCGNGGSAAQAQHMAAELVGRFLVDRPALTAVALTTDSSILTAVANDYSFEEIFERQVEALVREGDVLICFSTSGASANILKAAAAARGRGAKVLALAGRGGGKLGQLADLCLAVPADAGPQVQEGHLLLVHALCKRIEQAMFARSE